MLLSVPEHLNEGGMIMGDDPVTLTGGCMCGAVRYEAIGEPLGIGYCHCHSCRGHTGAPVVTYVGFKADQVRFIGRERSVYNSSPGVGRAFCNQCGTPLTWEGFTRTWNSTIIEFHISTLDDPDSFVPEEHWLHEERIAWFDVADGLPRYRGVGMKGEEPYRHGPVTEGHPAGA